MAENPRQDKEAQVGNGKNSRGNGKFNNPFALKHLIGKGGNTRGRGTTRAVTYNPRLTKPEFLSGN